MCINNKNFSLLLSLSLSLSVCVSVFSRHPLRFGDGKGAPRSMKVEDDVNAAIVAERRVGLVAPAGQAARGLQHLSVVAGLAAHKDAKRGNLEQ